MAALSQLKINRIAREVSSAKWEPPYTAELQVAKALILEDSVRAQEKVLLKKGCKVLREEDIPKEVQPFVLLYTKLLVPGPFLSDKGLTNFRLRIDIENQDLPLEFRRLSRREDYEAYNGGTIVLSWELFSDKTKESLLECQKILDSWDSLRTQLAEDLTGVTSVAALLKKAPALAGFFDKVTKKPSPKSTSKGLSQDSLEAMNAFAPNQ